MEMPEPRSTMRDALPWRRITLYLLTAVGVGLTLRFAAELLFSVTGALTLGIVLDAPRRWLRQRMGAGVTAGLLIAAVALAFLLPASLMTKSLVNEVIAVVRWVQDGSAQAALIVFGAKHQKISGLAQQGIDQLSPQGAGRQLAGAAAGWVAMALRNAAVGVTHAVLMLFLLFFVLRDRDQAVDALRSLVPMPERQTEDFLARLGDVTHAIFLGRFLIAALQGTLAGLGYWVLGVPGALLWGTVTGVMSLIPAFGAVLVWAPIAVYLGLAGSWTKALGLAIWGGLIVSTIDNILYPVLVGQRADLATPIIFVAVFGGLAVFGFSGFVLGPVIVAAAMLLLREWKSGKAA